MARVRWVKVKRSVGRRRRRAPRNNVIVRGKNGPDAATAQAAEHTAVPAKQVENVAKAPRAAAVLPIVRKTTPTTVAVIGSPSFRTWICGLLALRRAINVLFDRDGPVTGGLSRDPGTPKVVVIDGETGHQLAVRAPARDRVDVLANLPVLLIANAADFQPPNEVGAVIGRRWSVLLASNTEKTDRLVRSIQRAASGRTNIDPEIDKELIRVVSELNRLKQALKD